MNNSMISAMVAMSGIQQKLGVVSDNIANADTVGYKGKQATFEDVFTAVKQQPGAASALPGRVTGAGYNLGFGARMGDVTMNTAQGEMQTTNNPTDLAIQGDGMFAVSADGKQGWTREGSFHFVPSATDPTKAFMATDQGYLLMGKNARGVSAPLEVPAKTNIQIDDKGVVRSTDSAGKITILPQTVQVDRVIHPEGLTQMDGNLFMLPTGANLNDVVGTMSPTTQIRQGFLEGSNVDLSAEMSELITVQRAYQLAARTLSSSDNMMSITNSIRG
ncbi:flagellar basal-body rod protein FlgG [Paenibacillus sp. SORGH_AS306]|uniref:Flagellar hook-basal body protein n=1 Tax=Paenibacillus kyungheensis TaxID=1452732 RepID=A0AAX3LZK5_9BACL|nr:MULTISPECIES: flagellar hook-basal body protein [Paenibacillus]MDQ1235909.1 flagellar basal-body rod protein FlgG [Paenibacillus sp. SORGH_AS_0306]MDR6112959.1 flagellar basal-body rod protein FlgG [Paenibacillus sp. SORGH_AS_0338]WCT55397.1 flagellar hook-basal body protein [Paenibacillus kyungheensis]WDF51449.1 flagellar hook-basal body protein [Paenibacillus sp. KACC 21273]